MNKRIIIETEDKSFTIFDEKYNEIFHSKKGALTESIHVFINSGLKPKLEENQEINILEIGFGTGLNALLTLKESLNIKVNYVSLEAYPISKELWSKLDYQKYFDSETQNHFFKLHEVKWDKYQSINDTFYLKKINTKLEDFKTNEKFDLIYFDAFSPDKQPELWTQEIFQKMYSLMKKDALLVTYCAKGQVRRNLIASGLKVEKLAGPPGKREMLRARKEL